MKRRIKVFLSLIYTVVFLALAGTGVLHSQAGELDSAAVDLKLEFDPELTELDRVIYYGE